MTNLNPGVAPDINTTEGSYVDWGAIVAGAVVAAAISSLMTAFGAAIGLSAASPYTGQGISVNALGIASAIYLIWVMVSSFLVGGYLAGRLRRRFHDASQHESEIRDGSHGLVVWALGAIMITLLAASSIGGTVKAGADVVSGSVKALTQASGPVEIAIDRLVRTNGTNGPNEAVRASISRIIGSSVENGSISDADKSYLTSQVASVAGISPDEATRRVNDGIAEVNTLADKAKQAAERARKVGIIIGFLSAATLAIAAASAWWAATMGGKHRNEGIEYSPMTSWR